MAIEEYKHLGRQCDQRCARCGKVIAEGKKHYGDPDSVPEGNPYDIWCEACNEQPARPTKDDGGPADPQPSLRCPNCEAEIHATGAAGKSLRDWFAGMATDADIANQQHNKPIRPTNRAEARYAHADEMLCKRAKGGE